MSPKEQEVPAYVETPLTEEEQLHPNPHTEQVPLNETASLPVIDQHNPPGKDPKGFVEPGKSIGGDKM